MIDIFHTQNATFDACGVPPLEAIICVLEKNCWMTSRENNVFLPLKCSLLSEIVFTHFFCSHFIDYCSSWFCAKKTVPVLLLGLVFLNTGRVFWQNLAERKSEPWTGVAASPLGKISGLCSNLSLLRTKSSWFLKQNIWVFRATLDWGEKITIFKTFKRRNVFHGSAAVWSRFNVGKAADWHLIRQISIKPSSNPGFHI